MPESPFAAIIAKRLRSLRAAHEPRIRQDDVAKAVGASPASVSSWEAGKNPPPADKLRELAEFYDVSTDYLVGRADHPSGLSVGRYLVDLDVLEAILKSRESSDLAPFEDAYGNVHWCCAVPPNPKLVGTHEHQRLRLCVAEHLKTIIGR